MSFFCVWGAAESHLGGKLSPPNPEGVTPAVARTILFLVLPMRSCREGPEHFGLALIAFLGSRRLWCVNPRTRVSRLLSNRLSGKTQAKSSLKALTFMPFGCGKLSRGINLCSEGINLRLGASPPVLKAVFGIRRNPRTAPPLGVSGKGDQKLYLQPTCTYPGRRNLHEQLGHETRSGETAGDCQGGTLKKKTVPRVSALSRFSGRCPFSSLCTLKPGVPMSRGSNVPVLRLGVPMSRGSNVPREGKPGCVD